jgi:hypothetical protein
MKLSLTVQLIGQTHVSVSCRRGHAVPLFRGIWRILRVLVFCPVGLQFPVQLDHVLHRDTLQLTESGNV